MTIVRASTDADVTAEVEIQLTGTKILAEADFRPQQGKIRTGIDHKRGIGRRRLRAQLDQGSPRRLKPGAG